MATDMLMADGEAQEDLAGLLPPALNVDLFGHEDIEKSLLKEYQSGRLPHAIVLTGDDGIGKATLAYRLARFLFAEGQDDAAGGGLFGDAAPATSLAISADHSVSRRIASGGHADLLVIERPFDEKTGRYKTDIPVDEVRRIPKFLSQTAAEGGWRIVIVDGAEALNRSAQNALLKILEEPPKQTLLILTSSKPGLFLPTIRSRCRFLNLKPLAFDIVTRLLRQHDPELSDAEIEILTHLSEGSIGRATALMEEEGVKLYREMIGMISSAPNMDLVKIHEWSEKLGRKGAEKAYHTTMQLFCWWLSRLTRFQSQNQCPPAIVDGEDQILQKLIATYPPQYWLEVSDDITQIVTQTQYANLDKRQAVLSSFQRLSKNVA